MKKYILYDETKHTFWFILHYPKLHGFSAFKIEDVEKAYEEVKEMLRYDLLKLLDKVPESFLKQSSNDWWQYEFCLPLFSKIHVYEIK